MGIIASGDVVAHDQRSDDDGQHLQPSRYGSRLGRRHTGCWQLWDVCGCGVSSVLIWSFAWRLSGWSYVGCRERHVRVKTGNVLDSP